MKNAKCGSSVSDASQQSVECDNRDREVIESKIVPSSVMILSGSSNRELSEEVATNLGTTLVACRVVNGCEMNTRLDMLLIAKCSSKLTKISVERMFLSSSRPVRQI